MADFREKFHFVATLRPICVKNVNLLGVGRLRLIFLIFFDFGKFLDCLGEIACGRCLRGHVCAFVWQQRPTCVCVYVCIIYICNIYIYMSVCVSLSQAGEFSELRGPNFTEPSLSDMDAVKIVPVSLRTLGTLPSLHCNVR